MEKKFGLIFWIHLLVILLIWLSPLLFNWKIIFAGIILYYMQLLILGDCILTRRQFETKTREITFYYHLLTLVGFQFNARKVRIVADFVMPLVILTLAIVWQVWAQRSPLVV